MKGSGGDEVKRGGGGGRGAEVTRCERKREVNDAIMLGVLKKSEKIVHYFLLVSFIFSSE